MRRFSVEQRRVRLGRRHHLAVESPAPNAASAAEHVFGFHASDPATVYLSAWARVPGFAVADLERSLYEDHTLLRHMGMRRTLFTLPVELLGVAQSACGDPVAAAVRKRLSKELQQGGVAVNGMAWIDDAMAATIDALRTLGPSTGAQISEAVPVLRTRLGTGPLDVAATTRVLTLMGLEGHLVRDRPIGSWISSTHRWALAPTDLLAAHGGGRPEAGVATAELVRRWLAAFGPAPVADIVWWTGLGVTRVRAALATIGAVDVEVEVGVPVGSSASRYEAAVALPDDLDDDPPVAPWVALLPALDSTSMGWKQREWYVGDHTARLFDRNGNIGPTVWSNGRIIGRWLQRRPGGEVVFELFDKHSADVVAAVGTRVAELQTWLGPVTVSPRFPTPPPRTLSVSTGSAG
ncbi:MAG: hypothetical protein RLZZ623_2546 [Actinomycetota bacterium]